jgi:hypothetical protein
MLGMQRTEAHVLYDRSKSELEKLKLGHPFVEKVVRVVVETEAHRLGIKTLDPVNVVLMDLMPWAMEKAERDRAKPKPGGG